MAQLLRMPEISANTVEAVLAEWPLAENTAFSAGDAIATVETEKAVVDVPADADGVLLRTLIEPGKSVSVGTPMAVLAAPGEVIDDLEALIAELTGGEAPARADDPTPAGTREVSQAATPAAGTAPGPAPAPVNGATPETTPASPPGVSLQAGSALSTTAADTSTPGLAQTSELTSAGGPTSAGGADSASASENGALTAVAGERVFASPLARRIAKENGLAVADIPGTGPGGRIVRDDVRRVIADRLSAPGEGLAAVSLGDGIAEGSAQAALEVEDVPSPVTVAAATAEATGVGTVTGVGAAADGAASVPAAKAGGAPSAGAGGASLAGVGGVAASGVGGVAGNKTGGVAAAGVGYRDIPHTRMRRAIASRLAESSREAPVFTIRGSARVDALLALRKDLNAATDVRVSVNDLIVAAAARAHVAVPEMNSIWMADAVRQFDDVDIAVAVATDKGLVTPVVRGVQRLAISALARASADAVARSRDGKLRQDELEGGTLTVTNLGVFGTEDFTAVINPPQAAILAVGAARQEAVVTEGDLGVATVLRVTLSVDHRPVDGATAAKWMAAFLALLESPLRILA